MQSPFIIRYHGSFMHDERMYIVTEYAEKGDLHCFLRSQEAPLPEPTIWRLLIQVGSASDGYDILHAKPAEFKLCVGSCHILSSVPQVTMGLHHMHSKRILHRDVKSLNIFLDANYNVKVRHPLHYRQISRYFRALQMICKRSFFRQECRSHYSQSQQKGGV
jgi:NIMA (never in mitosis gene a)-related kinase